MSEKKTKNLEQFGRVEQLTIAAFILLIVIGVLSASGLSERIISTFTNNPANQTFQNSSQPFSPTASNTPQLSKELIYSGSRLLTVEDANANAAPPADLAVWRPSSGVWFVLGGAGSQQTFQQWGTNGDVAVPGDFDGDGKTDFSIWRPSDGSWWVLLSSTATYSYTVFQFGSQVDMTTPADFDGDGKTDYAVFNQPNGYWHIWRSSTQSYQGIQFGSAADIPVPADYDGDGKADIGVWRNDSAAFYSINSSNGIIQIVNYGQSGDVPVCGDYDGDGRADYAVKRGNQWIIRQSSNLQTQTISWEQTTDKAVQNDYDGDGKLDVAVWRESNGTWYIRNSSNPSQPRIVQWRMAGDIPVPAFYRR